MNIKQGILFGWMLTQFFYLFWYIQTGYIFGKSDVDNYLNMPNTELKGLAFRHILIQYFIIFFGVKGLVVLIPLIYWAGIVLPLYLWHKDIDSIFPFIFGTASIGLFFIVGLWSQFISMAFMIWGFYTYTKEYYHISAIFILLSMSYLPIIYFYLIIFSPLSIGIVSSLILYTLEVDFIKWTIDSWQPIYALIFYISPLIVYRILRYSSDANKARYFILSINRLARGLIFIFPTIRENLSTKEKYLTLLWCILVNGIILYGWYLEINCLGAYCR